MNQIGWVSLPDYAIYLTFLGSRPETAWRAWRCCQAAHQYSPALGFVSSCLAVSWIPSGDVRGLLTFWCDVGNFIMCWGSIWYVCLIWWLILLLRCLCEWLEFRLRLRDLGVQVRVWKVLSYQKFDINDVFNWLLGDYEVVWWYKMTGFRESNEWWWIEQ